MKDPIEDMRAVINKGFDTLSAERLALSQKVTGGFTKIAKIESANPFNGSSSDWVSILEQEMTTRNIYSYGDVKPTPEALEAKGLAKLAEMKAAAEVIHLANVAGLESNKKLVEKLTFLMTEIEMPGTWQERIYEKSRKRWGSDYKMLSREAGWKGDIIRNILTSDGYDGMTNGFGTYTSALVGRVRDMRTAIKEAAEKEANVKRGTEEHQRALAEAAAEIERLKRQVASADKILGE